MPDSKITALASTGTGTDPANDPLVIVDVSDTSMAATGTTKKVTLNNLLACSPTATLASATITGDLTVATSVLKVDSANTRVGINTTTINGGPFNVKISPSIDAKFVVQDGFTTGNVRLAAVDNAYSNYKIMDYSALSHAWFNSGSTAMTLNSTGLGVGVSPAFKLDIAGSIQTTADVRIKKTGSDTFASGPFVYLNSGDGSGNGSALQLNATNGLDIWNSTGGVWSRRMIVDIAGNLGIGVTPSAWGSGISGLQVGSWASLSSANAYGVGIGFNNYYNGTNHIYSFNNGASKLELGSGLFKFFTAPSGTAGNAITFTQAMTLDASGNLLVGTTSALASGSTFQNLGTSRQVLTLKGDAFGSYTAGVWNASTTNDGLFVYFGTEATLTVRGGISYNRGGGLVAYNTTSDYRAKDIIGPVSNSGSLIDSLKVYVGKMNGATIERPMLIAHEAQEVAPYAVTGTKDEVDADGNPKYQQMDVSSFVPLLIAEIQSLRTRVQTLETR